MTALTVALAGTCRADYASEVLVDSPLAYYRFNDGLTAPAPDTALNAGSLSAAGNAFFSDTVVHATAGALPGSTDTAARFTNSGFSVPWQAGLNNAGSFTIEAWLKADSIPTEANLTSPLSSMHVADPRAGWIIYQGNETTGWNFRTYNENGTSTAVNITTGGGVVAGTWYHVAAVWNATTGTGSLYLNGVLKSTSAAGLTYVPNADAPLTIGSRSDNAFGWTGSADEPAYYNKALSAARILAHYNNGINPAPAATYQSEILADTPVGYWRLNESAFIPATAANAGSLGASANAGYRGLAINGTTGPSPSSGFPGFGAGNSSLVLDGSTAYVGTGQGLLNNLAQFTVMGWVKRGAVHSERGGYFGQNDLLEFGDADTGTTFEAYLAAGPASLKYPFDLADDQWGFIALTGNATESVVYLNGEPVVSRIEPETEGFGASTFSFNIGGGGVFNAGGDFFKGEIDEVAVLDRALSPSRIKTLYDAAVGSVPPTIVSDPPYATPDSTQLIFENQSFTLTADASGTPPFTYQWLKGGAPIASATGKTYTVPASTTADSGFYSVKVSNPFGAPTSSAVQIVIERAEPPLFNRPPAPRVSYTGGTFNFVASVTGTAPFTYQWFLNGEPIPNATNPTYAAPATAANEGAYTVRVTNFASSVTSTPANATLISPASGSYDELVLSLNPVAFWKFEETAFAGALAADIAHGNDGIYFGSTAGFTVEAPRPENGFPGFPATNRAADFDGFTSYVRGPAGFMNGRDTFTLSGWFRRAFPVGHSTGFFGQNDKVEFGFSSDTAIGGWTGNAVGGFNPIPDEKWAFVVFTSEPDPAGRSVYINGNRIGKSGFAAEADNDQYFSIGGGTWNELSTLTDLFTGQLDEVALFNQALTPSEIAGLYLRATGQTSSGPEVAALPGGNAGSLLVSQTFDDNSGGFTVTTPGLSFEAQWNYNTGTWRSDGEATGFGSDNVSFLDSPAYPVTAAGAVILTFSHHHSFEGDNWDGGNVSYSLNNGPFLRVSSTAFSEGAYNGTLRADTSARLASQEAFVGNSAGHPAFITSTCVLTSASPGDTIRVRFTSATDNNTTGDLTPPGWEITSFSLTQGERGAAMVTWPVGILQKSTDLVSPWQDVTGNDPVVIDTLTNPRLFFRTKP